MKTESAPPPPNTNTMDQIAPSRLAVAGSGTGCVACGLDQDADKILLCDGCDAEYHTTCLVPPLNEIPEGDFYCKSCKDAKRHVKSPASSSTSSAAVVASASNGATEAGFAVQDEHGRIVPVRSDDVRESKYKGVLKLLTKGAKKPFVARVHKDGKYMQLGIYGSEIEAAHACDKASIELFGRAAQLNFPHLHDGFMRGATTDAAAKSPSGVVAIAPAAAVATATGAGKVTSAAAPGFGMPGRGRGRGRGGRGSRGGAMAGAGGGRGKRRLEDSPARGVGSSGAAGGGSGPPSEKKRKALAGATGTSVKAGDVPVLDGPKYLGVQIYRSYSHAQIAVNGKTVNLGTFPTPVDAAIAYDKAALKYFGGEIGSKDALHDRVVLNFPNKRAELLKQLIEESMHRKARQAGGGGSGSSGIPGFGGASAANRSMQSAKHNLSIKKLENWLLKLQRSVKLVEAAHRVQWDGLPLVKPENPANTNVAHGAQDGENVAEQDHDMKLELLAGAGPTIKTDFTKKQQRLRASASQIQHAVDLMVQELKIYADDAPVDVAFQPPPRSHALLDLMSTSRFLKLCSTINELAHSNATASVAGRGPDDHDITQMNDSLAEEDTFAALVQTVVDYRTRLQMAASAEKQKLAGLVEPSDAGGSVPSDAASGAVKSPVAAAIGSTDADAISREILKRAKYVKRKVQRIRTVKKTRAVPLAMEATTPAEAAETKKNGQAQGEQTEKTKILEPATAEDETAKSATKQPESANEAEAKVEAVPEAMAVEAAVVASEAIASDTTETKPDAEDATPVEDDAKMKASEKEATATDASEAAASEIVPMTDAEPVENGVSKAEPTAGQEPQESSKTEDDGDQGMESVELLAESKDPPDVSAATEDATAQPTDDVTASPTEIAAAVEEEDEDEEEETIVDDDWEFCLALQAPITSSRASVDATDKDTELWHLLPIESESGEFVANILLTDDQVAAIEVTEREVCGGASATWKPQLVELHQREITLRERVKNEMDRRQALERVIKIEQERLSQVFVVYRRMLKGVVAKSSEVQKRHQRITRDLLLVELMKQTFAPILDDLLQQCESVFVERLEKMADRFDDFQQEFEYYTDALLSVVSSACGQSNGHVMKDEELPDASMVVAAAAERDDGDDAMDGESSGLRGAYVSFYMEEIETLWKERCRAVESLYAILRSLTLDNTIHSDEEANQADVNGTALLRRRVHENLDQWKEIKWPAQLATPPFVASFMKDSSHRGTGAASLLPLSSQHTSEQEAVGRNAMGELKQIIIDLTQESPTSVTSHVARHSTLVVYHPVFLEHQTPKDHPECPERLNRIVTMLNSLRKKFDDSVKIDRLTQSPDELSPSDSTLLAVHSPAYLQQLKHRASEASANGELGLRRSVTLSTSSSLAASALVFETNRGVLDLAGPKTATHEKGSDLATRASPTNGSMGGAFGASNLVPTGIAMDTYVSNKSWDVARAAAGTVCLAVDRVVRKEFRNAACLVRPPGHHVGRHGRTLDAPSSGFCLLNNVVIGAVHARQYPWIRRVAVLDWDIHHGNGTEELMRDDPDGFFASIHLYASGKFFPGTGKSERNGNLVNVALEDTGAGSGSAAFRSALRDQILPAMRAFEPDIIFISAGFDGHKDDILGGRAAVKNTAVPAGYLEDDYVWATQQVLQLADECCDGRVVSVLEGGYDVRRETNSLAKSVAAHVGAIASYAQDKLLATRHASTDATPPMAVAIKRDRTPTGVLLALLAKDLNDDDVVIIDDDEEEEDDGDGDAAMDKSGGVVSSVVTHEHDHDGDDDDDDDDDGDADDMEEDGVEVEDDEDDHHDSHEDDVNDDDVVMTDDHDDDDHSVDGDDDDPAGLSFAASLSVDGDDDDHADGESTPRIETPDYGHLDAGTGEEDGGDGDDIDADRAHDFHNGDEEDDRDREGDLRGLS